VPQSGQRPSHLGAWYPQFWQRKMDFPGRAAMESCFPYEKMKKWKKCF
jgi:hypothetical protein